MKPITLHTQVIPAVIQCTTCVVNVDYEYLMWERSTTSLGQVEVCWIFSRKKAGRRAGCRPTLLAKAGRRACLLNALGLLRAEVTTNAPGRRCERGILLHFVTHLVQAWPTSFGWGPVFGWDCVYFWLGFCCFFSKIQLRFPSSCCNWLLELDPSHDCGHILVHPREPQDPVPTYDINSRIHK